MQTDFKEFISSNFVTRFLTLSGGANGFQTNAGHDNTAGHDTTELALTTNLYISLTLTVYQKK